jgi:hypothetical protein
MDRRPILNIAAAVALVIALGGVAVMAWRYKRANDELAAVLRKTGFEREDVVRVRQLLRQGARIQTRGPGGMSVLLLAAAFGDEALMSEALDRGVPPDEPGPFGMTPLSFAAGHGKVAMVRRLLEAGADPNRKPELSGTPLIRAAGGGHPEVVRILLAHGADPNLAGEYGHTALWHADAAGAAEVMAILRAAGAGEEKVGYDIDIDTAGVRFLSCTAYGDRHMNFDLEYRAPGPPAGDISLAVSRYARLRLPGDEKLLGIVSAGGEGERETLIFDADMRGREVPARVEVWWVKGGKRKIATVPCSTK